MLKVHLAKNLRRNILRGHPWVYKESLRAPANTDHADLCRVYDQQKAPLAWAIYDPHGPLALRILSLEKTAPESFSQNFAHAWKLRQSILTERTNACRLFNGEGDLLPGLVCDIYNNVAVLQYDGAGPKEFWSSRGAADWILKNTHCQTVVEKPRGGGELQLLGGTPCIDVVTISENNVRFNVNINDGQKTGFFLDQRENREYVRNTIKGGSVLNVFSYTGGFSVYAGLGGAKQVSSLDFSAPALAMATENWLLNDLPPANHETLCQNAFDFFAENKKLWDCLIVDPPSMAPSEKNKPQAIEKYTEAFAASARLVKPGGHLFLSSCSSHIDFNDFLTIVTEALSRARRRGQILRVSGQGADHPFPHALPHLRYLKFCHLVVG